MWGGVAGNVRRAMWLEQELGKVQPTSQKLLMPAGSSASNPGPSGPGGGGDLDQEETCGQAWACSRR